MNRQPPVATAANTAVNHHHQQSNFHPSAFQQYHDPSLEFLAYHSLPPLPPPPPQQLPDPDCSPSLPAPQPKKRPKQRKESRSKPRKSSSVATPSSHPSESRYRVQTRSRHHQPSPVMANPPQLSDEDFAELQKLSNEFEPEATGPLVSQRQQSTAITSEYATADPIYQAKTAALAQTYSHYRTVRGDGKCGWRAVAFGYFETLIKHANAQKFAEEEARLQSLSEVLVEAGFEPALFDDFAEETFELLQKVAHALPQGHAEDILLHRFNDEAIQNYIITHLRTLAAGWMKTNQAEYQPWLLGQTVDQFCNASILPVGAEIDHVGLSAIKDVLLSPAGIALEVLYLDRSAGSEVTMHRFDPINATGHVLGNVRLLYRPGHYDLLYKPEDIPVPPPSPTPTYLHYSHDANHGSVYDLVASEHMARIPGMSYISSTPQWLSPNYDGASDLFLAPESMETSNQDHIFQEPVPYVQPRQLYSSPTIPTTTIPTARRNHNLPPLPEMPKPRERERERERESRHERELPVRTIPVIAVAHSGVQNQVEGGPFRPSAWQLEPDLLQSTTQSNMQTSIFRNSHFNTSHFLNPEFQPEQWDPDDEYVSPPYPYGFAVGRRARNRSLRRFITMENFVAPRV